MIKLLRKPIAFNPVFAEWTGSINAALMLSQAIYWDERTGNTDGWFYKTHDQWTQETCMSRREQDTARKKLIEAEMMDVEVRGVPAKLHFRVRWDTLEKFYLAETAKTEVTNAPNQIGGMRQTNTENTTETTEKEIDKEKDDPLLIRVLQIQLEQPPSTRTPQSRRIAAERNHWKNAQPISEDDVASLERFYSAPKAKDYDRTWNRKTTNQRMMQHLAEQIEFAHEWDKKNGSPYAHLSPEEREAQEKRDRLWRASL